MENNLKRWEQDSPEVGEVYKFKNPVVVKSIRIPRGKVSDKQLLSKEEELKERTFEKGKLIKIIEDTVVFLGHKIPAPGRKKPKANYLFKLQNS